MYLKPNFVNKFEQDGDDDMHHHHVQNSAIGVGISP